jgi:flotillin
MYYIVGTAVVAVILLVLAFRLVWRVAEPNEALIISGLGAKGDNETQLDSLGFKIVVGRGTAVIPGFQTVRRLGLDLRATGLVVNAVSNQSIPLTVKGVVAYKVGDDLASIANAARRFLDQDATVMQSTIHELFAGHLRAIVGGMSVEDMLHNREELTANIRASLAEDLQKLGLRVDSLQIQEIDDESGYIQNLAKPQAAAIGSKARIAAAQRDKEATEAEQIAYAEKAGAVREASIKQSEYQAQMDQAKSKAEQAGPLSQALARQEVVRAETAAAELDAQRQEKLLESSVRKPADAKSVRAGHPRRSQPGSAGCAGPGAGRGGSSCRCGPGERHPAQRCRSGIRDPGEGPGRGCRDRGARQGSVHQPGRCHRTAVCRELPRHRCRSRRLTEQH